MNAPLQTANTGALSRYRMMRRIRSFEERVGELFLKGGSAGSMLHLSMGKSPWSASQTRCAMATASPPTTAATAYSWAAAPIRTG